MIYRFLILSNYVRIDTNFNVSIHHVIAVYVSTALMVKIVRDLCEM